MAIAFDHAAGGEVDVASTTVTPDITTASTGAHCFLWIGWAIQTASFTQSGWTQLGTDGPASTLTCGLFYRQKQAGDTTFTFTTTSAKGSWGFASYTGLDTTTPYQFTNVATNMLQKSAAATTVSTPSVTNTNASSWALGFFASRTSTSGNKVITFTPDAALTERLDQNNSAAASGIWIGVEIADSAAAVTAAAHSYTATASFSETFGEGALIYLNPAAATAAKAPSVISQYAGFY